MATMLNDNAFKSNLSPQAYQDAIERGKTWYLDALVDDIMAELDID